MAAEKDALVRMLARHILTHRTPEHCTADCMAGAILAAGWTRPEATGALARAWEQGHEAGFHYAVRHEEFANPYRVIPPGTGDANGVGTPNE